MATGSPRGFFKVARWCVLAVLIIVIVMMLKRPTPPAAPLTRTQIKENAQQFESKLQQIERAQQRGSAPDAEATSFTADEVNAFLQDASERAAAQAANGSTLQEAESQIKSTQVAFTGDEVVAQAVTVRYGQDVYITVRGRLGTESGYLRFDPTGFKIGDLNVPVALVDATLQKKLHEPEQREKLRLPEFVSDLRIENGRLVMVPK